MVNIAKKICHIMDVAIIAEEKLKEKEKREMDVECEGGDYLKGICQKTGNDSCSNEESSEVLKRYDIT